MKEKNGSEVEFGLCPGCDSPCIAAAQHVGTKMLSINETGVMPEPGDLGNCLHCGAALWIGDDGELRVPTREEIYGFFDGGPENYGSKQLTDELLEAITSTALTKKFAEFQTLYLHRQDNLDRLSKIMTDNRQEMAELGLPEVTTEDALRGIKKILAVRSLNIKKRKARGVKTCLEWLQEWADAPLTDPPTIDEKDESDKALDQLDRYIRSIGKEGLPDGERDKAKRRISLHPKNKW